MTGLRHRIHNKSLDPLGVFWFEPDVFLKTEIHFLDIILLNIGEKNVFLLSFYSFYERLLREWF